MELYKAHQMAELLMARHGVGDYEFRWMKKVSRFRTSGKCDWKKKIIYLQPTYVELNSEDRVKNTILHEIAHALRPKHGHNKHWRKVALEIGCDGKRCYSSEVIRQTV